MILSLNSLPPKLVSWGIAASPVGKLLIGLTERGEVCRVSFLGKQKANTIVAVWRKEWKKTQFSGGANVKNFAKKPILLVGTEFQHKVWRTMMIVPAGYVTTYGEIAKKIGKKGASRAVGSACGANPVPYLVPCHRVIAANSGLGGFSGGIEIKKILLKKEGAKIASN